MNGSLHCLIISHQSVCLPSISSLTVFKFSMISCKHLTFFHYFAYLIGKNFVGKKWRNIGQLTKNVTDENICRRKFSPTNYFYRRLFIADENFKIVLFCNNFSCRSKVLGSLRSKSDLLRIYSVWDPTYSRKYRT